MVLLLLVLIVRRRWPAFKALIDPLRFSLKGEPEGLALVQDPQLCAASSAECGRDCGASFGCHLLLGAARVSH